MAIQTPNTGSTYSSDASVPNSANRWAILGFTPNAATAGSMVWWTGTAASAGSPLFPITACGTPYLSPQVFVSATGFFAASITGGCAVIWLKTAS